MKKIILIATACLLAGCSQSWYQQRDIKKLDGLSLQYSAQFAQLANKLVPCFNGVAKSDTVKTEGKADTIYTPGSTSTVVKNDTVYNTITQPGRQVTIPNFITIRDTIPDNRALTDCSLAAKIKADSLATVKIQYSQLDKTKDSLLWWVIGLGLAILLFIIWKIYIFISGGVVKDLI
ncbi:hypothetical protein [Mucilaginibacter sp.]